MGKRKEIITIDKSKELTGVHYTIKHTGKMQGMQSLSTSCLENRYCRARHENENLICSHCYANTQMQMYPSLKNCLKKNTEILTSRILNDSEIPFINAAYFRFESFGDLNNEIQLINYFNVCKKNKHVHFALWTKNYFILNEAITKHGIKKPRNLQIVFSDPYINGHPAGVYLGKIDMNIIDKVFTVYTKEYIEENNIDINCGEKCCLECRQCYVKNKITYINEKLK